MLGRRLACWVLMAVLLLLLQTPPAAFAAPPSSLATPSPASAGMPSSGATPLRVVILTLASQKYESIRGFRDYLLAAAGRPVDFVSYTLEGDAKRLPEMVQRLKAERPDMVFTQTTMMATGLLGTLADRDAARHLTRIPVVFTFVSDPVGAGLAAAPADGGPIVSGRNYTGTIHVLGEDVLLRGILAYRPIKRLIALYDAKEDSNVRRIETLRAEAAKTPGLELEVVGWPAERAKLTPEMLTETLERVAAKRPDILYTIPQTELNTHLKHYYSEATRLGLPTFCALETHMDAGCMAGLMPPLYLLGQFTAHKAMQILRGEADPGAIPIETLPRFSYIINLPVVQDLKVYPTLQVMRFAHLLDRRPGAR